MLRSGLALASCLAAMLTVSFAAQQPSLEYDVKAAFILNFVRFVEWPPARRLPPLQLCVLQTNPFGKKLEAVVAGEHWHGAPIEVRVVPDVRRGTGCHLLYVPAAAANRFASGSGALAGLPVLTIGEHQGFLEQGGMIRLFVENNYVRFSINRRAAEAVGLAISSRLLRLARTVIGTSEER